MRTCEHAWERSSTDAEVNEESTVQAVRGCYRVPVLARLTRYSKRAWLVCDHRGIDRRRGDVP